jgi:hypothetical protein
VKPALPKVIAAFFHATNTRDFADFLLLFTSDAHVNDEANDHFGDEIAAWIDQATADTKPIADVTDMTRDGEQFVVTAEVSGNFPVARLSSATISHSRARRLRNCSSKHEVRPRTPIQAAGASAGQEAATLSSSASGSGPEFAREGRLPGASCRLSFGGRGGSFDLDFPP